MSTIRRFLACACVAAGATVSVCAGAASPSPRALDRVPQLALDVAETRRAVAAVPPATNHGPQRIAVTIGVSAGLDAGAWEMEGSTAVWRLRLYSAGARLMLAHLDELALPEGATLRFMNPEGSVVQGPWSRRDLRRAGLWTPMVPGEAAVLELRTPAAMRDAVRLHVAAVGHGLVDPYAKDAIDPKSGSCNIDVACPQGDAWRNQIRSVVRLQIPNGAFVNLCTGQLLNNVAQDDTPYIVTAHHCGIRSGNADGVVAYYNYQTSTCGGAPNGSLTQNQTGATLRVDHATSDHTLIELDAPPSAAFNVYYSGFDASSSDIPSSGATIHHPAGDEKRISLYVDAPTKTNTVLEGNTIRAFKVFWDQGVTEQGSSGSGLWNQDKQVVGVLSGGASSCANPAGEDYYGRLEYAWTSGNVKAFLDPANTGRLRLCGQNPGTPCDPDGSGGGGDGGGGGGGGAFGWGLLAVLLGAGATRRLRERKRH